MIFIEKNDKNVKRHCKYKYIQNKSVTLIFQFQFIFTIHNSHRKSRNNPFFPYSQRRWRQFELNIFLQESKKNWDKVKKFLTFFSWKHFINLWWTWWLVFLLLFFIHNDFPFCFSSPFPAAYDDVLIHLYVPVRF